MRRSQVGSLTAPIHKTTPANDVGIVGRTVGSYVTVAIPQNRPRTTRANACGYIRLASSSAYQHTPSTQVQNPAGQVMPFNQVENRGPAPSCRDGVMAVPHNSAWLGS